MFRDIGVNLMGRRKSDAFLFRFIFDGYAINLGITLANVYLLTKCLWLLELLHRVVVGPASG